MHNRKRLDGTLQDLEEKQNSKKDAVCILPFHVYTHMHSTFSWCPSYSFWPLILKGNVMWLSFQVHCTHDNGLLFGEESWSVSDVKISISTFILVEYLEVCSNKLKFIVTLGHINRCSYKFLLVRSLYCGVSSGDNIVILNCEITKFYWDSWVKVIVHSNCEFTIRKCTCWVLLTNGEVAIVVIWYHFFLYISITFYCKNSNSCLHLVTFLKHFLILFRIRPWSRESLMLDVYDKWRF